MNVRDTMIILAALALGVGCAGDAVGAEPGNAIGGFNGGASVDPVEFEAQLQGDLGAQANIEGGIYEAFQNYDQNNLSFVMHSRGSGWAAMNAVNIWSPDGTLSLEAGDHILLSSPYEDDWDPEVGEPLEDGTIPPEQAGTDPDLEGEIIGCSGDTPDYDFDEPAEDVVIDVEECDDPEMLRLVYTATFGPAGINGTINGSFLIPREPGVATDDWGDWDI